MKDFTATIINKREERDTGIPDTRAANLTIVAGDTLDDIRNRDSADILEYWSPYAKENHTYLVPGIYMEEGYLCLCILDDGGNIIGEQRACHLNTLHFSNSKRDSHINIIKTPFASIFLCVDVDIYKPEVIRAAVLMGAEVVVSTQYIDPGRFNDSMILAGAWQNAQQNCIYILNAHNFGGNIIGPCETSKDMSGFICSMDKKIPEIYANLSPSSRDKAYESFRIFKTLNIDLYKRYF